MPHEGDEMPSAAAPQPRENSAPPNASTSNLLAQHIRIEHEFRPELKFDLLKVKPLTLDAYETPTNADLAPVIDASPTSASSPVLILKSWAANSACSALFSIRSSSIRFDQAHLESQS